jgi:hypothetical protein
MSQISEGLPGDYRKDSMISKLSKWEPNFFLGYFSSVFLNNWQSSLEKSGMYIV